MQLPFRRGFYVPLALLHASLALRLIGGDLAGSTPLWQAGGIAGEIAILLFLAATAHAILRARKRAPSEHRRPVDAGQIRHSPARG